MAGTIVQPTLTPQRARPNIYLDNTAPSLAPRGSSYNESYVQSVVPTKHLLSDEGSYFTVVNPTVGTGVAHATQTSFSSTAALFAIFNSAPVGGTNINLDYLRLIVTGTAPATSLFTDFLVQLDSASRTPTANNVALTAVNMNYNSPTKGYAQVQAFNAGSLTVPAQSTVTSRNASRIRVVTGQVITGDEYVIQFGGVDTVAGQGGLTAVRATDPGRRVAHAPPVQIAPQTWGVIYRWSPGEATNVLNAEYEIGFWER
jgi:hypothetical protein